jgi:peptidoglycan/xylan/chitin deacetylase (PgdA/CDA1 family)
MSRRLAIAQLLHRTGTLAAILKLRARAPLPWLTILTYHRFPAAGGLEPFDDGVVDVTLDEFDRQVACVKRHFTPVGVDELCAYAAGHRLPPNPVAITFDDGYLDGHELALPILRRRQCKAIFFIATSFIAERRMHWWDRVAYLVKKSTRHTLELTYPFPIRLALVGDRSMAIRSLLRLIKQQQPLDLERLLGELARAAEVLWTREMDRQLADRMLMSWDHVRALRRAGMDVQSHTRSHRVLQTLPVVELDDELAGSRTDLERELGEPVRAVAYPVGNPLDDTSPIRAALVRAGYQLGFTNGTGPTPLWGRVDPFNIRRQTVERNFSEAFFLSILAVPFLAPKHPWPATRGAPPSAPPSVPR